MIDIRDYDIAILNRIKSFFDNTYWVSRTNIPIKEIRDLHVLNGCDLSFPVIVVRRTNCPIWSKEYNSWSRANTGKSYNTSPNRNTYDNLYNLDLDLANKIVAKSNHHDSLSIVNSTFDLTYYLDVLSFERDNFDAIMVELQENLFRVPYLAFSNVKQDGTIDKILKEQACHLIVEEVEDTSDLENFDDGNSLYRATITLKVNAYIYRKYVIPAIEQFTVSAVKSDNSGYYYSAADNSWLPNGYTYDKVNGMLVPDGYFFDSVTQSFVKIGYIYNNATNQWEQSPSDKVETPTADYTLMYEVKSGV